MRHIEEEEEDVKGDCAGSCGGDGGGGGCRRCLGWWWWWCCCCCCSGSRVGGTLWLPGDEEAPDELWKGVSEGNGGNCHRSALSSCGTLCGFGPVV